MRCLNPESLPPAAPRRRIAAIHFVAAAIIVALGAAASAQQTAPREVSLAVGTDSAGVPWRVRIARNEPLSVSGARVWEVTTKEPLDFEVYGTIDSHDTAWIVDHKGRGMRVKLANGAAAEFRVPATHLRGIAVSESRLYFTDTNAAEGLTVQRLDVASGGRKTVVKVGANRSVQSLVSGKRHLWIVLSAILAPGLFTTELIAVDWPTGKLALRGLQEMPLAATPWTTLEVVESEDGAAWIANGNTSRIERLDLSGTWQGWSLGGRTPSNLVTASFGAAFLLRQLETQTSEGHGLPGMWAGPKVLRREIAVAQQGLPNVLTFPIASDATLSADGTGGVRADGLGRLSVARGRLQIAPEGRK